MLHKVQGIVIKYVKYKETSIIVNIFTDKFGLQTFIVNGVRSAKAKGKMALFQPLTNLELVIYHKDNNDIQRISEYKCSHPFQSIPINIKKSGIALFLTEILHKIIKEKHETEDLFSFIHHSILVLDHLTNSFENFHLQFLLKLSNYLGVGFSPTDELKFLVKEEDDNILLEQLNNESYEKSPQIDNRTRIRLLHAILDYYRVHFNNMGEIKSLAVLSEVMH